MFPFIPWFTANYIEQCIYVIERDYKLLNENMLKVVYPLQQSFQIEKR